MKTGARQRRQTEEPLFHGLNSSRGYREPPHPSVPFLQKSDVRP